MIVLASQCLHLRPTDALPSLPRQLRGHEMPANQRPAWSFLGPITDTKAGNQRSR